MLKGAVRIGRLGDDSGSATGSTLSSLLALSRAGSPAASPSRLSYSNFNGQHSTPNTIKTHRLPPTSSPLFKSFIVLLTFSISHHHHHHQLLLHPTSMASSMKASSTSGDTPKSSPSLQITEMPDIPNDFLCPILLDLMSDPVTTSTGMTYDRRSIEQWLKMGNSTCPITNEPFDPDDLIPNHAIRKMIQDWCVANRSRGIERIPSPRIPLSRLEASQILSNFTSSCQRRDSDSCKELTRRVRSLLKDSEKNRQCFMSSRAASVLAAAFRFWAAESIELCEEILATTICLFPIDDEAVFCGFESSDSLNSILQILKNGNISNRLNAVLMVKKMASVNKELARTMIKREGLVKEVVELIKEPISTQATKASLAVVFYFISSNETISTKLVEFGLLPAVLEITVDSDKSTTEKALAVLDGLCSCELGRDTACDHSLAIPVIVKKMFRVSDTATEFVVSTLRKLCENCRGRCLEECLQVGTLQKLVLLLQIGCGKSSKDKATQLLKLLSRCGKLDCVDTVDFKGLKRLP
ncbi:U-box domain-containing protein 21 [Apostasia shenzhenica]|uniref:U-box domain-containing protein n=1 Tax=Apostasia shenzhenica TaxID=1088818 RepID=A0A2I0BCY7_9ASPA|nr:U-box domain-containing protein 21 [Apostasia shenzhenica]